MDWRRAARALCAGALAAGMFAVHPTVAGAVVRCGASCTTVAQNDNYSVVYTTKPAKLKVTAAAGLLANDQAPTGLIVMVDTNCSCNTTSFGGSVALSADGSFTYTAPAAFTGRDSFQYFVVDAQANALSTATAFVTVKPAIANDSYVTAYNTALKVRAPGVFANDLRASFDSITSSTNAAHGKVVLNLDGSFAYTPNHNYKGADAFTYTVFDLNFDNLYTATVRVTVLAPAPPPPPPATTPAGYLMVGATGTVYPFGQLQRYGNANTNNVTHIEPTPSRHGYWILDASGRVFAFGDARALGGAGALHPGETAASISSTPTGNGYWVFTNRGRVFNHGDARFFGDMRAATLNGPIVGSIATPTGNGYYMVASDGGIFAFGDARFHGSMGGARLNKPVNGLVPTSNGGGYWLVASDGGIFAFGNATFHGSMGGTALNRPVIGMVRYGNGYLMVSSDGGIFAFSNLPFLGSLASNPPSSPIVGVASGG